MERDPRSEAEPKIRASPWQAKVIAIGFFLVAVGYPGGQLVDALSDGAYTSGSHIVTQDGNPAGFWLYVARAGFFLTLAIGLTALLLYKRFTQRRG